MTEAQEIFLKYVRTKMVFSLRLRGDKEGMQPVYIPSEGIDKRFFPFPKYDRKKEIQQLIDLGELSVLQRGQANTYEALRAGGFDLNLLQAKPIPNNATIRHMLQNIKLVSLPQDAASTPYFDLFLKYKNVRPDLFFTVDGFCGRIHTPVSNFHRIHRPNILLNNQHTTSLDVATMQPLLLGKILYKAIGDNEYSTWINSGEDIYIKLQNKADLSNRDEAKKKFFEILFSKPSNALRDLFGASEWINWINDYKQANVPANPHYKDKPHSNLAWLLQTTEVKIMTEVWTRLVSNKIPFLSVHDEIIIQVSRVKEAESIMQEVLSREFQYFKICGKVSAPVELTILNLQTENLGLKVLNPKNWEQEITELENYFAKIELPTQPVNLKPGNTIINCSLFIEKQFATVKANNGNRTFLPYLNRLQELKKCLQTSNIPSH